MVLEKFESATPDELARLVSSYRRRLGWSQQVLADKAECSRPTIARLEAGRVVLSITMTKVIAALNSGFIEEDLAINQTNNVDTCSDESDVEQSSSAMQVEPEPEPVDSNLAAESVGVTVNGYGPSFSNGESVIK